jgi:hypothetical protein
VLTTIHQYGSSPTFQRNETKFGPGPGESRRFQRKKPKSAWSMSAGLRLSGANARFPCRRKKEKKKK